VREEAGGAGDQSPRGPQGPGGRYPVPAVPIHRPGRPARLGARDVPAALLTPEHAPSPPAPAGRGRADFSGGSEDGGGWSPADAVHGEGRRGGGRARLPAVGRDVVWAGAGKGGVAAG